MMLQKKTEVKTLVHSQNSDWDQVFERIKVLPTLKWEEFDIDKKRDISIWLRFFD